MITRFGLLVGAMLMAIGISVHAADTIDVTCLAPNGGFTIDGTNFTVLVYGESGQYAVQPGGSVLRLWSCGWEDGCKWLSYTAYPGSAWEIVNVGGARIVMQELVPVLACMGFQPPLAEFPVAVRKNRALPLKAEIFDIDGFSIMGTDLSAPPVVQVWFDADDGTAAIDISDEILSVGQGDEGNQFAFAGDHWQFNLMTKNFTAPGIYTVYMESGNEQEYLFAAPQCMTQFVIR